MINIQRPVNVYRNLSKPGFQFSVQQGGRVRQYVTQIQLQDVRFKHATARQLDRVRSGPREVCQWINGTVSPAEAPDGLVWLRIACDPKKVGGFVSAQDGRRVVSAKYLRLDATGCWAAEVKF